MIESQSPIDDFSFVFVQDEVFVPYANWLAENDRFDEAQEGKRDCDKSAAKLIQLLAVLRKGRCCRDLSYGIDFWARTLSQFPLQPHDSQ